MPVPCARMFVCIHMPQATAVDAGEAAVPVVVGAVSKEAC